MNGWQTLVTVVLLVLCYGFGIIIHQLAGTLFSHWENRIKGNLGLGSSLPTGKLRPGLTDERLARPIQSVHTQMQICRTIAANGGVATIVALTLIAVQWQTLTTSQRWGLLGFALIVGIMVTGAATFTWLLFTQHYYAMIKKVNGSTRA